MARAVTDIRSLARSHTRMCLRVLCQIAASEKAPENARVSAATALLDRGWGKPTQTVEGTMSLAVAVIRFSDVPIEQLQNQTVQIEGVVQEEDDGQD